MIDLSKYKKPLLVAGHAIRISGAIEEFHELLEKLNVSVVTTFNGFDIIPSDHPNFSGRIGSLGTIEGNKALREAGLVICLGTRNNIRQVSYKWENFAKNAYKVGVDKDIEELKKSTIKFDETYCCDVKDFIEEWLGRKTISWSNA